SIATCIVSVFFFQAEDGIRDRNVTGVQTCALPIYFLDSGGAAADVEEVRGLDAVGLTGIRDDVEGGHDQARAVADDADLAVELRSEERRVGKEGRAGWAAEE